MDKIFIEWLVSQRTSYGNFKKGEIVKVPKDDGLTWIERGICRVPDMVEVTYVGKQQSYKWRALGKKEKYILNQNIPRVLPLKDVKYLHKFPGEFLFNQRIAYKKSIVESIQTKENLLLKYNGNYGDVLRLSGIIKTLYNDGYRINVKVKNDMCELFKNNPYVNQTQEHKEHRIIQIDDIEVHDKEQANILRVNTWLTDLGYEDSPYRKPEYYISEEEQKWAKDYVDRDGRLVIGIATSASVPGKTWDKFIPLMKILEKSYMIIVLDKKINNEYRFNLRQLGAVIDECDIIITGDSLILHIAGALDKHCICLFGNTDGKIMCQNYSNCIPIQGKCKLGKPCWYSMKCKSNYHTEINPCLKSIKVKDIIKSLEGLIF